MSEAELMSRITLDPSILAGKPVIRGLRISVDQVIRSLAAGVTTDDLLDDYPDLERKDIQACLIYAAHLVKEERVYAIVV